MKESIRRLPDSELTVMQAVWAHEPPVSKDDIAEEIYRVHPIAETTLLTLLSRLQSKGFLSVELQRRRKLYTPLVTQQQYLSSQGRRFLDTLCGGSVSTLASALSDGALTGEELRELRELLEKGEL
ncbi:MAG: BlaI/MecI/CopY family transcriptional regulator [Clostridia bacterium]|nr:BlaI/MecI/CopY family transcriptional regulator [Clostridia bacterium]